MSTILFSPLVEYRSEIWTIIFTTILFIAEDYYKLT